MSWTTTPSSAISVSGWVYNYNSFRTTPTSTTARFALHDSQNSALGESHDIEFRIENGNLVFDVNPSVTNGTSANPNAFTHQPPLGALSAQVTSATVNVGDTIKIYTAAGGSFNGSFVISSEFDITASSGGGTGTEGSSVPSASNYMNSQGQLVFVISSTSPSSDGNIAYKIFRRPKGGTLTQAYVVPHTSGGTDTEFNIGLNLSLYDRWELRIESSTALVQSAVLSVHLNNKKVFCNFW